MINGKISGGELPATVLADKRISDKDILTRKGHLSSVDLADEFVKAYDRGNSKGLGNGPDYSVGFFYDLHLPAKKEDHSPLPRNQSNEFVAGIQYDYRLHGRHQLQTSFRISDLSHAVALRTV
jgi:hypothetical protein